MLCAQIFFCSYILFTSSSFLFRLIYSNFSNDIFLVVVAFFIVVDIVVYITSYERLLICRKIQILFLFEWIRKKYRSSLSKIEECGSFVVVGIASCCSLYCSIGESLYFLWNTDIQATQKELCHYIYRIRSILLQLLRTVSSLTINVRFHLNPLRVLGWKFGLLNVAFSICLRLRYSSSSCSFFIYIISKNNGKSKNKCWFFRLAPPESFLITMSYLRPHDEKEDEIKNTTKINEYQQTFFFCTKLFAIWCVLAKSRPKLRLFNLAPRSGKCRANVALPKKSKSKSK